MVVSKHLTVREIAIKDIALICRYWLESDSAFLTAMGVDLDKLPSKEALTTMLTLQINTDIKDKKTYALIWELDNQPIGHSNVTDVEFGKTANMHLHLWKSNNRKQGLGEQLVKKSLPFYFNNLNLKTLICQPLATNQAPNKTLEKVGFKFVKKHTTIPGLLNYLQEVNMWQLTLQNFNKNIQHKIS